MSVLIKWDGFWTGGGEGELHLDIPTFVQRQTQAKIKQLVKSVLKISTNAEECARQIIEECEAEIERETKKLKKLIDYGINKKAINDKMKLIKKYKLFIDLVKPYVSDV